MIKIITISGCDDDTSFEMDLDEKEIQLLKLIELKSKSTSTYSCMPVLLVEDAK